jgi:membrane protein required for colicin V production
MDSLPVNILDLAVVVTILLGALVGLALGFVQSGLFILCWVGAIIVTIRYFPLVRPYGQEYIETPWLADVAAGGALFLVSLTIFFLISSIIGGWVRDSRLNALDRSLGMLSGVATAALLICSLYIVGDSMWKEDDQPKWVLKARALPLIKAGAESLRSLVPGGATDSARETHDKARKVIETEKMLRDMIAPAPKGRDKKPAGGYGEKERRDMERLIETNR